MSLSRPVLLLTAINSRITSAAPDGVSLRFESIAASRLLTARRGVNTAGELIPL